MLHWSMLAVALVGQNAGPQANARETNAPIIESVLREPPHDGLLMFEVLPNLQAAKAGFRVGDILVEYDGQKIRTTSQLQKIATAAARDNRGRLPVAVRRGSEVLQAEFDAAPMGAKFVAVAKGDRRFLWRPATDFKPNYAPVYQAIREEHRWDLLQYGGKSLGWAHTYFAAGQNGTATMRVQSMTASETASDKRDVTFRFAAETPNLALVALQTRVKDKLVLDMQVREGVLVGTRGGVRDSAPLPADCVPADLAGLVAATMPREKGACQRCSFLEANSVVAAPYSDIYCLGVETVEVAGKRLQAARYDQTVFGRSVAHYWIDGAGKLVQTRFGNGFVVVRSTSTDVRLAFPNAANEFTPIEQLPAMNQVSSPVAQ